MVNEILLVLTCLVSFSLILLAYRFFGKTGMYVWAAFASVVANIEVIKCVDMFGMAVTLGNVIYASNFLMTDILSEMHGEKCSKKALHIGFFTLISATLLFQISLLYIPNASDFASPAMKTIFALSPRICAASLIAYFISNYIDIVLFARIGKKTKHLWIKNNLATMTAQLLDSFMFTFMAFLWVFPVNELIVLSLTTYVIKVIIAALDTPFLYIARWIGRKYVKDIKEKEVML